MAFMGYGYLMTAGNESFLEEWIDAFIASNPRLFRGAMESGDDPPE
jgi:hypothetical protein